MLDPWHHINKKVPGVVFWSDISLTRKLLPGIFII